VFMLVGGVCLILAELLRAQARPRVHSAQRIVGGCGACLLGGSGLSSSDFVQLLLLGGAAPIVVGCVAAAFVSWRVPGTRSVVPPKSASRE
jgi:hypothetical protein